MGRNAWEQKLVADPSQHRVGRRREGGRSLYAVAGRPLSPEIAEEGWIKEGGCWLPPLTNKNGEGEKEEWPEEELLAAHLIPENNEGRWSRRFFLQTEDAGRPLPTEE